ncbi:glycosyl transferase, partial [Thaumarchaeota archaeon SCGC AB-539-E09]
MKVMIGIAAYEEEGNIENLLEFLINDSMNYIDEVYVVSSGSKDRTDDIVSLYSRKNSRINLILEDKRNGKVSALNQLLSILENDYDIMVYMGADNMPEKGSINHLLECIKQDDIMIVGGRPLPLNNTNNMMG